MKFAKRSKVCYSKTHMEATSLAEKKSFPTITPVSTDKAVDYLNTHTTRDSEDRQIKKRELVRTEQQLSQYEQVNFSSIVDQLKNGSIEISVYAPHDQRKEDILASQRSGDVKNVHDEIVGAFGRAGFATDADPTFVYDIPFQPTENEQGKRKKYAIFAPRVSSDGASDEYVLVALLNETKVRKDQQKPEDLKMEGAKSTAANAYLSPEDLMEKMSRESKDADGNQDKRPEDNMDEWYPPVESRSKGVENNSQPRQIPRPEVAAIEATEELQIGEMNEQDILSKLTKGQLEGLVKTGKLDNNALAYLATVIWEKYHRIGKAIQGEIEDEEGSIDDYRAIDILFTSHQQVLDELRSVSQGRGTYFAKAEFWGLTEDIVQRVLPNLDEMAAISKVLELIRPTEKTLLKFALLDEVNALISARLIDMMDRKLSNDELTELLATDSAGFNAFFDNFGKKPNRLQSIWATIRGRTIDAQPGSAIDFAQDLVKSIRENFMPTLETADDPKTVTIEGPQVPTEFEVNQFFSDNQQKAVDVVNALLEKYENTFEIKDPEKVALAKHVLDQLKYLVYTPGNEGNNMIDYADKQLKALGLKTMYRPEPKQPKEQQAPSIFATEFWKDWGETDDADSTLPKL